MTKLVTKMSMSVDGFIAGPHPAADNPLGNNGLKLHDWVFNNPRKEHEITEAYHKEIGAIIMGSIMYHESLPYWAAPVHSVMFPVSF